MKTANRFFLAAAALLFAVTAVAQNTQTANSGKEGTVYMVSNAHLDSQWNWDVQTSINEYVKATLFRNLDLMDQYPDYVFNCESGIKYSWMKEYYPDAYARLRKYVQSGQWHVSGAAWEASDANVPSTESLNRNILLGQNWYEKEFGVLSTDIFLPDCFGFGQHVPMVAAHCGLIGFVTQKLMWRNNPFYGNSKEPFDYGVWRGLDGSEVYASVRMGSYTRKFDGSDISDNADVKAKVANSPDHIAVMFYGTGDIGGSPTLSSVESVTKSVHGNGPVKVVSASSDYLFKELKASGRKVDTWDGELLMDVHGTGCYTSEAAMKLFNRRNELLADAAERSSVAAELIAGNPYPQDEFTEVWRRFIWHQFHDDLTGTSIPRAYEFSWNDELISLLQSESMEKTAVGAVSSQLDTRTGDEPLVIYNPSAFSRTDVVTIAGSWKVKDQNGKAVTSQLADGATMFVATVPATGYAVYSLKAIKAASSKAAASGKSGAVISNSIYTLTVNADGDISSIVDRRCGRELVAEGKVIRLAAIDGDKSENWPAWEVLKETIDKPSHGIDGNVTVDVIENGPVCSTVRISKTMGESKFVQYVRLYEGAHADRIDFVNDVDWHSMATLLKAEFPLSVSNPDARYDIGTGSLLRNNNTLTKYEVYAQQWADLTDTDGSYGVSILNDCKYGWDKPADNTLRLTLLHTPKTARNYSYHDHQDLGHHVFTYSIIGHQGDWNSCGTEDKAEALNQPLRAFRTSRHEGSLGREWSLLKVDGASVKAFKKAEDGSGYIVRVYETTGKPAHASLQFGLSLASVEEVNGIEKPLGATVPVAGSRAEIDMKPFSIRTFKVCFASTPKANGIPQQAIDLPFNARSASYNAFRHDVSFNLAGESFAAELIPQEILHGGVTFPLGKAIEKNALLCAGNELKLPEGNWTKVRLLVAATDKDVRTSFYVGVPQTKGKTAGTMEWKRQEVFVPCFSGFIGQWGHTGHTTGFVKNTDIAYVGTHRHSGAEDKDLAYEFGQMFCVEIDVPQGATVLKLPVNNQVAVFSAVAVNDSGRDLQPVDGSVASNLPALRDVFRLGVPVAAEPEVSQDGIAISKDMIVKYSGYNKIFEVPAMMLDGDRSTKWCQSGAADNKFVEIDLGSSREIHGWTVLHAGLETPSYITADFCLQVRQTPDEDWKTVDSVKDNTDNFTDRNLQTPVSARYVRFYITRAHQIAKGGPDDCGTARIYEFGLR